MNPVASLSYSDILILESTSVHSLYFVAPDDYETLSVELTFSATVNRSCASVIIHEDIFAEGPEEIGITLTTTDSDVTLGPSEEVIVIEDDESTWFCLFSVYSLLKHNGSLFHAVIRVRFVEPSYTLGEAMGTGFIEVKKTGVAQEPFSVIVQGGTYISDENVSPLAENTMSTKSTTFLACLSEKRKNKTKTETKHRQPCVFFKSVKAGSATAILMFSLKPEIFN